MSTSNTINTRIKLKRDTESNWDLQNPTILNGELVLVDSTDGRLRAKIGDGTKQYESLEFVEQVHIITEDNKDDDIPANAVVVIDTTEDDLADVGESIISPTIAVTSITGGYRMEITDMNGTQSFNIMHGEDGQDGKDGKSFTYADFTTDQLAALKGDKGDAPVKGTDYWTDADKAAIVNDVLAALPNGNEVAY